MEVIIEIKEAVAAQLWMVDVAKLARLLQKKKATQKKKKKVLFTGGRSASLTSIVGNNCDDKKSYFLFLLHKFQRFFPTISRKQD